jgi:GcrA cell cycle regulator
VIGKVHRLGLTLRGKPTAAPRKPRASTRKFVPKPAPTIVTHDGAEIERADVDPDFDPEKVSEFDATIAPSQRLRLDQLTDATCKWPVGDPQEKDSFYFCGGRSLDGLPYCAGHCRVAYQPAAVRGHRITISPEEHARRVAHGKALAAANRARRAAQS